MAKDPYSSVGDPTYYGDDPTTILAQLQPTEEDRKKAFWQSLMAAGLGILANNNGKNTLASTIGQGGLLGFQTEQEAMKEARDRRKSEFLMGSQVNAKIQDNKLKKAAQEQIAALPSTVTQTQDMQGAEGPPAAITRPLNYDEQVRQYMSMVGNANSYVAKHAADRIEMLSKFKPEDKVVGERNLVRTGPLMAEPKPLYRAPAENKVSEQVVYNPDQVTPGQVISSPVKDLVLPSPDGNGYVPNTPLIQAKKETAPQTNVTLNTEKTLYGNLATGQASDFLEEQKMAKGSAEAIKASSNFIQALDKGAITGVGADLKYKVAKFLNPDSPNVGATESALTSQANAMLANVKKLTGPISEKEMPHLYRAAGGEIDWSKAGLRALHTEMLMANQKVIDSYNAKARKVDASQAFAGSPLSFEVQAPEWKVSPAPDEAKMQPKATQQGIKLMKGSEAEQISKLPPGTVVRVKDENGKWRTAIVKGE